MRQAQHEVVVETYGKGLVEVTGTIAGWLSGQEVHTGLLVVHCLHTSASLVIQENADPDVREDLERFFAMLVRDDPSLYRHTAEGPDDMPAHIRSVLTASNLSIPVRDGHLALGTWQGIHLFEHRHRPHRRSLLLHLLGE